MLSLLIKLELILVVVSKFWLDEVDSEDEEDDDVDDVEDNAELFIACSLYCGSTRWTGLLIIG